MRRRGFAAVVGAALLAVIAGCGIGGPTDVPAGAGDRPTDMPSGGRTASVPGGSTDNDPVPVGTGADPAHEVAAHLPLTWTGATVVRPGWSELPAHLDGMFLGFAAPDGGRATLRYLAVDTSGTVRWQAERPATCTGFALIKVDGQSVAVLTDLRADGARLQTTASGFDLESGRHLWGPVPVPGSLQGPGLVFAAPAPSATMGTAGPRVALDPATGRIVVDEAADPRLSVVGEYAGTVLTADATSVHAEDAQTGDPLWHITNPSGVDAVAPADAPPPPGTALIGGGVGPVARLIDLDTGEVLATAVRAAAFDDLSGNWLTLGEQQLTGIRPGEEPWSRQVPAGSRLVAVGSGLVYVMSDGVGRIFNSLTGSDAGAYDPEVTSRFAVPQMISHGAAVFRIDGQVLLATAVS